MVETIKPVRYGILIGLFSLIFGIGWAFWLVLGHERVHKSLEERATKGQSSQSLIQLLEPDTAMAHTDTKREQEEHSHEPSENKDTHQHAEEGMPRQKDEHTHMMEEGRHIMQMGENEHQHFEGAHDSPIMELSHTRLKRGHLHAMGLGLVTIAVSFILSFVTAPDRIKAMASILTGFGGFIYPLAWIVMGYRTPALGPDAAEASVTIIAGPGIALVLLGIFTAAVYLLRDIFSAR